MSAQKVRARVRDFDKSEATLVSVETGIETKADSELLIVRSRHQNLGNLILTLDVAIVARIHFLDQPAVTCVF